VAASFVDTARDVAAAAEVRVALERHAEQAAASGVAPTGRRGNVGVGPRVVGCGVRAGIHARVASRVLASVEPCVSASVNPCVSASVEPCVSASVEPRVLASVRPRVVTRVEARVATDVDSCVATRIDRRVEACVEAWIHAGIAPRVVVGLQKTEAALARAPFTAGPDGTAAFARVAIERGRAAGEERDGQECAYETTKDHRKLLEVWRSISITPCSDGESARSR
jgi:hypothetical protein